VSKEIVNTYDQLCAAGGGVAICYRARGTDARLLGVSSFQIMRVVRGKIVATDPGAPWYNHGKKTILVCDSRADALAEAKRWVAKKYREKGPWKRNRMHDYVPARINDEFPLRGRR
jgi:hypothetical protein